jgi:hypothetical protein
MEPEVSLLYLKESATGLYPEQKLGEHSLAASNGLGLGKYSYVNFILD